MDQSSSLQPGVPTQAPWDSRHLSQGCWPWGIRCPWGVCSWGYLRCWRYSALPREPGRFDAIPGTERALSLLACRTGKFAVFVHAKMPELKVTDLSKKLQGIPGQIFHLQLFNNQSLKHQILLRAQTE